MKRSSLLVLIFVFCLNLISCSFDDVESGTSYTVEELKAQEATEELNLTSEIELTNDIEDVDVYKKYHKIIDSYLPDGYIKTLDYGMYFSGSSIVGNNGDIDDEYLCYMIDFNQNGNSKSFILPCNKMSTQWLNRILLSLLEDATQELIENNVKSKYVALRGLKFRSLNSDTNLLQNPYKINLNKIDWGNIYSLDSDIVIYASLVNTDDKEMLLNYVDDLSKYIEKQGYDIKLTIKEY